MQISSKHPCILTEVNENLSAAHAVMPAGRHWEDGHWLSLSALQDKAQLFSQPGSCGAGEVLCSVPLPGFPERADRRWRTGGVNFFLCILTSSWYLTHLWLNIQPIKVKGPVFQTWLWGRMAVCVSLDAHHYSCTRQQMQKGECSILYKNAVVFLLCKRKTHFCSLLGGICNYLYS